ncbi:MAG: hypothetical protein QOD36_364 [Mycobacterium sp.]|nr:hypothetical protein [Mycobacterium sp.]MDT5242988.1 hypothetical protein [Mycobacterium sp.]
MLPLLAEDDAESLLDGEVLHLGPAGLGTSHVGGELRVGQRFQDVSDHRLAFAPDREHLIE